MADPLEGTNAKEERLGDSAESGAQIAHEDVHSSLAYSTNEDSPAGESRNPEHTKLRLRKACDSCSIRKVKCDEQGPPCQPCAALDIPCTSQRPSRRRGPPNRHAEALKKRRLDEPQLVEPHTPVSLSPTSWEFQSLHEAFGSAPRFSAEMICPMSLLLPLLDDYFVYIHPLVPIPHEPTFRASLARRDDLHDRTFLSLIASMIGALVVSFPRKPRLHLKAQQKEHLFPNFMSFVDRCSQVSVEARGAGFLDKDHSVYDATTSYLMALIVSYSFRWKQSKLYFGECLNIIRSLGLHRVGETTATDRSLDSSTALPGVDFITQELGKRLFWVLFVGIRSIHQLSASVADLYLPPETPQEPYPPLPLEIDDEYISATEIRPQPAGITSALVGFNANVRVYRSYAALSDLDTTYGVNQCVDWDRQSRVVQKCLVNCKHSLDGLPRELLLRPGRDSGDFGSGLHGDSLTGHDMQSSPRSTDWSSYSGEITSLQKRRLQYEIQKANIYVSQLCTRSHIVERYWAMCETFQSREAGNVQVVRSPTLQFTPPSISIEMRRPEVQEPDMTMERGAIVDDLFGVLGSISQINMEPNGASLINKIRQIASTLLDVPSTSQGKLAARSRDHLMALVEVLMKLERVIPSAPAQTPDVRSPLDITSSTATSPVNSWTNVDEEAELRHWADLREYQSRFANSGGVLSNL